MTVGWEEAFSRVSEVLASTPGNQIKAVVGPLVEAESMIALKDLFNRLGSSNLFFEGDSGVPSHGVDFRSNYLLNTGIANLEHADAVLLIGTNPRTEAPLINARLRKGYVHRGLNLGLIGSPVKLTAEYAHLGDSSQALADFIKGSGNAAFTKLWKDAKRPVVIVGSDVTSRPDADFIFAALNDLAKAHPKLVSEDWNGISVLHRTAARAAALDMGFVPGVNASAQAPTVLYLLGADDVRAKDIPKGAFVIYQGHHGDVGAHFADVILPGAAYTEKSGTYVNTEGRVQLTRPVVSPPGNAREDWKIVRALSEVLGFPLPYESLRDVRERLGQVAPHLADADSREKPMYTSLGLAALAAAHKGAKPSSAPFVPAIKDYYLSDPISRASQTMAKCSTTFTKSGKDTAQAASA